jgi:fructose transport system permease protein
MTTKTIEKSSSSSIVRPLRNLIASPAIGPLLALFLAGAFFYSQNERFIQPFNISLILQQTSWIAALAIGQTLIILTAGIDLSNGLVMALGTVIMTKMAVINEVDPMIAVAMGFGVTMLFGLANGLLITQLKLPPFIVTLGTLNIAFALTRLYTTTTVTNLPDFQRIFGERVELFGTTFTYGSLFPFVIYILMWFFLRETAFGRHVYAIGDDPEAARLMGIPVNRVLIQVYILAGFFYALAGWLLIGRIGSGDPNAGQTANLDSITAVVIGGTSLFGGRGSMLGTLIGALIVGVFINGLQLTGVDPLYQRLITGILVILAVAFDQLSQKVRQS